MTGAGGRQHRRILLLCLAAGFTTLLDSAIVTLALPSLRESLHATPSESQWILASYSLSFGLALVPAGRLGDLFDRRLLFILGVGIFSVSTLLSGLAVAPWMVITARLVQGAAAGTISAQVLGMIQDTFTSTERTRALGLYGVATSVAGLLGPLAAGGVLAVFAHDVGWRVGLMLSLPPGVVTCAVAIAWLPARSVAPAAPTEAHTFDGVGLGLLGLLTVMLILPFVRTGTSVRVLLTSLAIAAIVLCAFLRWERIFEHRGDRPVFPRALREATSFTLGSGVAMCWFAAQIAQTTTISLFLIVQLRWTPLAAATASLSGSIGMGVASLRSWRFLARFGRPGITRCLLVQIVAAVMLVGLAGHLSDHELIAAIVVQQLVMGLANGCIEGPNRSLTLGGAPTGSNGVAGGTLQLVQRLAATICVAAVTRWALNPVTAERSDITPLRIGVGLCAALLAGAAALSAVLSVQDRSAIRVDPSRHPTRVSRS